eukprot:10955306-Alexandrium_andersonii.AAC.1
MSLRRQRAAGRRSRGDGHERLRARRARRSSARGWRPQPLPCTWAAIRAHLAWHQVRARAPSHAEASALPAG